MYYFKPPGPRGPALPGVRRRTADELRRLVHHEISARVPPCAVDRPARVHGFFGGNLVHGSGPNRTRDRSRRTFIGHYVDAASEQLAKFYHPVLDMRGEAVGHVAPYVGGGPCGGDWRSGWH